MSEKTKMLASELNMIYSNIYKLITLVAGKSLDNVIIQFKRTMDSTSLSTSYLRFLYAVDKLTKTKLPILDTHEFNIKLNVLNIG